MEIKKEHVEWAVVHRLSKLLGEKHEEYNVTSAYSSFATILCWVMQRIQPSGQLFKDFEKETAEDWGIHTGAKSPPHLQGAALGIGPFPEFAGRKASKFLRDLRNAVAHGDDRTVVPFHRPVNKGRVQAELAGLTFCCEEKDNKGRVVWKGNITLLESDMRRLGTELADRYCKALGGDVAKDASKGVSERNADAP
ncbi:MAG: hypothetical protein ACLP7P_06805 [Rhodomicrobium sp.]